LVPGVPLAAADEVRKFLSITDEEYRGVVVHHVPVAVLGRELQRKAANVALGIRCTQLSGHRGPARRRFALPPDVDEQLYSGVPGQRLAASLPCGSAAHSDARRRWRRAIHRASAPGARKVSFNTSTNRVQSSIRSVSRVKLHTRGFIGVYWIAKCVPGHNQALTWCRRSES
jgi:hypothetical protein